MELALNRMNSTVINEHIKERCAETSARVLWLLRLEQRPCTLNGHYYSDYRDKFMAHYRANRPSSGSAALLTKLGQYPAARTPHPQQSGAQGDFQRYTAQVLSGLSAIGITGVTATDLPKLLPSDPYEPALNIMACVRAYFQGARSRCSRHPPSLTCHIQLHTNDT